MHHKFSVKHHYPPYSQTVSCCFFFLFCSFRDQSLFRKCSEVYINMQTLLGVLSGIYLPSLGVLPWIIFVTDFEIIANGHRVVLKIRAPYGIVTCELACP